MTTVHRVEVSLKPGRPDPRADRVLREARRLGVTLNRAAVRRVYLVQANLSAGDLTSICDRLLADPVVETASLGAVDAGPNHAVVEVHPLAGVMDPAAISVTEAIGAVLGRDISDLTVSTGWRFDLDGATNDEAESLARRSLANPVVHRIHVGPWTPESLPSGQGYALKLRHVPILALDDAALERLSRDAHLFLSLDEMRAIRDEFTRLGREPTDIELETIAQTWSEHCVHKTLKATVRFKPHAGDHIQYAGRPGHTVGADGTVTISNLLKSTVAAATHELIADGLDWTLSVFVDNSGVVALDDTYGVCIKVETHNHPSAIEPYGGSATGIGGCIRDVIGTGLGAKPIASTDVFCVAHPTHWREAYETIAPGVNQVPPGALHPRRVLTDIVAGVRDYGNRMGIPTVNGAVVFDDRFIGNPLVFCGCIGLIPRRFVKGQAKPGDLIVALGGRTGRDGIHGATFSSAELTDTHADEFGHAVQIGNAIEEKRVLDAILRARDDSPTAPLYSAMTDCGAGGFSSAVGEMGSTLGASVNLDAAPLKYDGLSYTEIWISEAQERMVLSVPAHNLARLRQICDEERAGLAVLGTFGTPDSTLILNYRGTQVGALSMSFLHDGIPTPLRDASWSPPVPTPAPAPVHARATRDRLISETLLHVLAHPNVASKHWIIRQYDHEVQGNTVIKPLVGRGEHGPSDASVIEVIPGTGRGIAIGCGLSISSGDPARGGDPYWMALAGIDECVRNLVCVGADPSRIAILDNFCWPSCQKPVNLGALVRAAEGCYDGAKAYRTPFVSGKDSLNNQFTFDDGKGGKRTIEIPPTLLITGLGIVDSIERCITSDAKRAGSALLLVGPSLAPLGGSTCETVEASATARMPIPDLARDTRSARTVAALIAEGLVLAAHDISDGGLLTTISEMLIGAGDAGLGATLTLDARAEDQRAAAFGEGTGRYVLEIDASRRADAIARCRSLGSDVTSIGTITDTSSLRWEACDIDLTVARLASAWMGTLDW